MIITLLTLLVIDLVATIQTVISTHDHITDVMACARDKEYNTVKKVKFFLHWDLGSSTYIQLQIS